MKIAKALFLFSFIFLFAASAGAQRILQLEKAGKIKPQKFYIGDELTFQYGDLWYVRTIMDLHIDQKLLFVEDGVVPVNEIQAIKTFNTRALALSASNGLFSFGGGWLLFSLGDAVAGGELTWSVAVVSGTAFAAGFILRLLLKEKKHKIGKRKRLRLLDLTIGD